MLEALIRADVWLFYLINNGMQNPVFDVVMPIITNKYAWFPVFLVLIVGLLWKGGYKGRMVILLTIPVILLSDQVSASLIKPWIGRLRPCVELDHVNALLGIKKSLSFPSSHAANSFAAATLFSYFYPARKIILYSIAVVICYSRVYLGVHYPLDVTVGAVLGVLCAKVVYHSYLWIEKKIRTRNNNHLIEEKAEG